MFDAIVYVDELVHITKTRIIRRPKTEGRESLIIDVLDFDKLKDVGDLAFDFCDGTPIPIHGSRLSMKIRPPGGFRVSENIATKLQAVGFHAEGLGKEEMLFLCAYGVPRSGLMAYCRPGAFKEDLLRGLLAGMQTYLAP